MIFPSRGLEAPITFPFCVDVNLSLHFENLPYIENFDSFLRFSIKLFLMCKSKNVPENDLIKTRLIFVDAGLMDVDENKSYSELKQCRVVYIIIDVQPGMPRNIQSFCLDSRLVG